MPRLAGTAIAATLSLAAAVAYAELRPTPGTAAPAPPPDAAITDAMGSAGAALRRAGPGYVLVLGDSNAASAPAAAFDCPGTVVNAGIGGMRAAPYLRALSALDWPGGGEAAVVNVGTGDAWRKSDPMAPASRRAYLDAVEAIVALAAPRVKRVVVAALPPLDGHAADKLDPAAVESYSTGLSELCGRIGCVYADPWAADRGPRFGLAKAGRVPDGLHPADPGAAYASISSLACPGGRRAPR